MRLIVEHNLMDSTMITTLVISSADYLAVQLNELDRALLRECDQSEKVSDKILALELLARRIEEAQQPRNGGDD